LKPLFPGVVERPWEEESRGGEGVGGSESEVRRGGEDSRVVSSLEAHAKVGDSNSPG